MRSSGSQGIKAVVVVKGSGPGPGGGAGVFRVVGGCGVGRVVRTPAGPGTVPPGGVWPGRVVNGRGGGVGQVVEGVGGSVVVPAKNKTLVENSVSVKAERSTRLSSIPTISCGNLHGNVSA